MISFAIWPMMPREMSRGLPSMEPIRTWTTAKMWYQKLRRFGVDALVKSRPSLNKILNRILRTLEQFNLTKFCIRMARGWHTLLKHPLYAYVRNLLFAYCPNYCTHIRIVPFRHRSHSALITPIAMERDRDSLRHSELVCMCNTVKPVFKRISRDRPLSELLSLFNYPNFFSSRRVSLLKQLANCF